MKLLKSILLFLLTTPIFSQSITQQVVNSTFIQGSTDSLSFESSIGETLISTKENTSYKITEGFLQPYVQKVVIYGNLYPCPNDSITLSAVGGSSYVWYDLYNENDTLSTDSILTFFSDQDYSFGVKSPEGLKDSVDIILKTIQECPYDLIVYNLITPNNDGDNDYLFIENIDQSLNNSISVFNRWGQMIFEEENYHNDWTPTDQPNGTYVFIFKDYTLNQEHRGKIIIEK